jgi:hypothetical protein
MPALAGLQQLRSAWEPVTKPLDEAAWQAWIAKNRALEQQRNVARVKGVKWISAATLFATAGIGSHLTAYGVLVRVVLALGAILVTFHALHLRRYAFAAVFGALALLYNPVAPILGFSGDWRRALMITSTVLFAASIAWPTVRLAHNRG